MSKPVMQQITVHTNSYSDKKFRMTSPMKSLYCPGLAQSEQSLRGCWEYACIGEASNYSYDAGSDAGTRSANNLLSLVTSSLALTMSKVSERKVVIISSLSIKSYTPINSKNKC